MDRVQHRRFPVDIFNKDFAGSVKDASVYSSVNLLKSFLFVHELGIRP